VVLVFWMARRPGESSLPAEDDDLPIGLTQASGQPEAADAQPGVSEAAAARTSENSQPGVVRFKAVGALRAVVGSPVLILCAVGLFVHGVFRRAIFRFEPVYLSDLGVDLGGIGLAASIPAVIELAAMPLAGRVAQRNRPVLAIGLGLITWMVRVALVAIWPSPEVIVVSKILGGIAYAFETVGVVELVAQQVEKSQLRATMALFTVSLLQVIGMVGNPIAGVVYDSLGAYPLYLLSTAGTALGLAFIGIAGRRATTRSVPDPM